MNTSINLRNNIPRDRLNEMYEPDSDYYWYLHCPEFVRRFLVPIGSTIQRLGGCVLDVGCGEGWLHDYVGGVCYHGIDGSETAIERAKHLRPSGSFEVARMEEYHLTSPRTFSIVVFGNMLFHAEPSSYVQILNAYQESLKVGYFIVYELQRTDTSNIANHFDLMEFFEDKAEVKGIPEVKWYRKVEVYSCG